METHSYQEVELMNLMNLNEPLGSCHARKNIEGIFIFLYLKRPKRFIEVPRFITPPRRRTA